VAAGCVPQESEHVGHAVILTDRSRGIPRGGATTSNQACRHKREQGDDGHQQHRSKKQGRGVVFRPAYK
jgi:hypothetical protein